MLNGIIPIHTDIGRSLMNTNLDSVGVEIGSSSLLIHVVGSVKPAMILHFFQCWSFPKAQMT